MSWRALPSVTASMKGLPSSSPVASIVAPFSAVRNVPSPAKFSSASPIGSVILWHPAQAAAVELEKEVAGLLQIRAEQVEPAYAKALDLFNKAATAARGATDAPASGKGILGDAQLAMAEMHWQQASGNRAMYIIPGCYMGNAPPTPGELRAGCDINRLITR